MRSIGLCFVAGLLAVASGFTGEGRESASVDDPLAQAVSWMAQNRLAKAEPVFRDVMREAPEGGELWVRAAFGYANVLHQYVPRTRERIERANTIYGRIAALAPDTAIGLRCRFLQGVILEWRDFAGDQPDYEAARTVYLEVLKRAPEVPIGVEAAIRYASTRIKPAYGAPLRVPWSERETWVHNGLSVLESELLRREPSPFTRGGWEFVGEVYLLFLKDDAKALEACLRATGDVGMLRGEPPIAEKLNLDRINQGYMYWRIAQLSERTGHNAIAIEYYKRMLIEVPTYHPGHPQIALRRLGVPEDEIPKIDAFERGDLGEASDP